MNVSNPPENPSSGRPERHLTTEESAILRGVADGLDLATIAELNNTPIEVVTAVYRRARSVVRHPAYQYKGFSAEELEAAARLDAEDTGSADRDE